VTLKILQREYKKTFMPARNLLFLSIAANKAYSKDIPTMTIGACQEDFGGYTQIADKIL